VIFPVAGLAVALLALAPHAHAQATIPVIPQGEPVVTAPRVPFGVGERLEYQIKAGPVGGSADMEILALDTVRGRQAWHTQFNVRGGIPFFRVNDRYESWIDVNTISSLRYKQDIHDGSYERRRLYEFYPEKRIFIESGKDTAKTVERPVDEASILYLIRTLALPVGLDTTFNNYFLADRNPIRIRVLGREHITVPAGEFDAVIIQPQIKTKGIFSEGGQARVWLSDDERHIILQMKSKVPGFPLGSLNLYLKSYRPAGPSVIKP
jgi:uncharacterized protein DUF3108